MTLGPRSDPGPHFHGAASDAFLARRLPLGVTANQAGTQFRQLGDDMAADFDHSKEMKAHEGTYGLFIGMMKWGTIVAAILTLIVIWLIT